MSLTLPVMTNIPMSSDGEGGYEDEHDEAAAAAGVTVTAAEERAPDGFSNSNASHRLTIPSGPLLPHVFSKLLRVSWTDVQLAVQLDAAPLPSPDAASPGLRESNTTLLDAHDATR